ncbi:hypothetical protein Hypma_006833 [Hypsizygus marmoreus]|uniref:Uncharacterized protein n=1 Tax=Hypsizygus marmoreus TaxID=39966 RepID=A0A369JZA6_HYPMA|nr:hypothetical protein Hypma_006833 [Hypsizygus marmoreus]
MTEFRGKKRRKHRKMVNPIFSIRHMHHMGKLDCYNPHILRVTDDHPYRESIKELMYTFLGPRVVICPINLLFLGQRFLNSLTCTPRISNGRQARDT